MSGQRRWDLPEYGRPTVSASLAGVPGPKAVTVPPLSGGQTGHKIGEGFRTKVRRKASAKFVLVLMIVTSAIALVDLYLLGTAIPH